MYCQECGEKCAQNAKACPHCGYVKKSNVGRKVVGAMIFIMLIAAGFVLAFPEYSPIEVPSNAVSAYALEARHYVEQKISDIEIPEIPAQ